MPFLRRIAVLPSLFTALVACDDPVSVNRSLAVTAELDRSVVVAGDPAIVTLRVVNRGRRTEQYYVPGPCQIGFVVFDSQGQCVGPSYDVVCSLVPQTLSLEPGAERLHTMRWDPSTRPAPSTPATPLAAGTYHIRPMVITPDGRARSEMLRVRVVAED